MKEAMQMVSKMDMGKNILETEISMKDITRKANFKEKDFTNGMMALAFKVNSSLAVEMVMESGDHPINIHVMNTKASIKKIKSMVMESTGGQTGLSTMEVS